MDGHHEPSRDSLALARKHVRALTDGGLSRQALLRALLEQEEAGNDLPPPQFQTIPSQPQSQPQPQPQPQLKKSASLSRTLSLSQAKSKSHWSVSTNGKPAALSSHLSRSSRSVSSHLYYPMSFARKLAKQAQHRVHWKRVIGLRVQTNCRRLRIPAREAASCPATPSLLHYRPVQAPSPSSLAPNCQGAGLPRQVPGRTGAPRKSATNLPA